MFNTSADRKKLRFVIPNISPCCWPIVEYNLNNAKYKNGLLYSIEHDPLTRVLVVVVDKSILATDVLEILHVGGFEEAYSIPENGYEEIYFSVDGLLSAADAQGIREKLATLKYISDCKVDYSTATLTVTIPVFDPAAMLEKGKEPQESKSLTPGKKLDNEDLTIPGVRALIAAKERDYEGHNSNYNPSDETLARKNKIAILANKEQSETQTDGAKAELPVQGAEKLAEKASDLVELKKDEDEKLKFDNIFIEKDKENRPSYLRKIQERLESNLNEGRNEEKISLKLIDTPIKSQQNGDLTTFLFRAAINGAVFFPSLILSSFIPAPTTLLGKLIGLGLSGITFVTLWQSGKIYFQHALSDFKNRSFSMYTLVALGTGCAWLYSLWLVFFPSIAPGAEYQYVTANMVLFFVNMGQAAKSWASQVAEQEVKDLTQTYISSQPQIARRLKLTAKEQERLRLSAEMPEVNNHNPLENILKNATIESIPYLEIKQGDYLLVPMGTRVPVEGTILNNVCVSVSQGALTGEARLAKKRKGNEVYSGSLIFDSQIFIQAKHDGSKGRLHQVMQDAAAASQKKPVISSTVDRVARIFTPTIIFIALSASLFWWVKGYGIAWSINIFMSVLLGACPCAFSLATPITVALCIRQLMAHRILVHHPGVLETAPHIDTIIFDKTGTLTTLEVQEIFVANSYAQKGLQSQDVLRFAASLEQSRELRDHPIAQAFLAAIPHSDLYECVDGKKIGTGVSGTIIDKNAKPDRPADYKIYIGTREYIQLEGIDIEDADFMSGDIQRENILKEVGYTSLYMAINKKCCALIGLKHTLRKDAKPTIQELQKLQKDIYILTGDKKGPAHKIAEQLGLELGKVYAGQTEDDKRVFIESLKGQLNAEEGAQLEGIKNLKEMNYQIETKPRSNLQRLTHSRELIRSRSEEIITGELLAITELIRSRSEEIMRDKMVAINSLARPRLSSISKVEVSKTPPFRSRSKQPTTHLNKFASLIEATFNFTWLGSFLAKISGFKRTSSYKKGVLMVGDGINDMKAIAIAADIGVALGSWAKVSSSAHMAVQNLHSLTTFFIIAKAVNRNIYQNLAISAFYNLISIATATGLLYPTFGLIFAPYSASAAMAIPSLLVILNALSLSLQIKHELKAFNMKMAREKEKERQDTENTEKKYKIHRPQNQLPAKLSLLEKILHTFPFRLLTILLNYAGLYQSTEQTGSELAKQKTHQQVKVTVSQEGLPQISQPPSPKEVYFAFEQESLKEPTSARSRQRKRSNTSNGEWQGRTRSGNKKSTNVTPTRSKRRKSIT